MLDMIELNKLLYLMNSGNHRLGFICVSQYYIIFTLIDFYFVRIHSVHFFESLLYNSLNPLNCTLSKGNISISITINKKV